MNTQSGPLNYLLPELFPVVASLLPLHATPSTLLSLALVNHHISSIVLPLLYSILILNNRNDALKVLQKLLHEPDLGKVVRQVHIFYDWFPVTWDKTPFDVPKELETVINAGSLPYIHTLGLYLMAGWYYNCHEHMPCFNQPGAEFYESLGKKCPRLRTLIIRDISNHDDIFGGFYKSGLPEAPDLTNLILLHTLDLEPIFGWRYLNFDSASPIFSLHFPYLHSLSLRSLTIENPETAMAFWKRHPTLEYLKLERDTVWFTNELPSKFLPNLRHLKADFDSIRAVAPILHQLVSLRVSKSINTQVPYLIRFLLPEGLPNLKSLYIGQTAYVDAKAEGRLWHETEDGKFMEKTKVHRGWDHYIRSIARGAPNLEEIGFLTYTRDLWKFADAASEIGGLSKLKRLYYGGLIESRERPTLKDEDALVSYTKTLAEACGQLTTVVNTTFGFRPYVASRILRDSKGRLVKVDLGTGVGMHFGNDDQAFPRD